MELHAAAQNFSELRFVLSAGGTGGHIFPALAVAEEILAENPGAKALFIGSGREMEAKIIDKEGLERKTIKVKALKGRGLLKKLKSFLLLPKALLDAFRIIKKFKPNFCLTTGGYVCGPVGLAAKLAKIPLIIHEQNALPGLTNRYLARWADLICLGLRVKEGYFSKQKTLLVGNPIRQNILNFVGAKKNSLGKITIAIVGGSQGAGFINNLAIELLPKLIKIGYNFKVIHQTGSQDFERCKKTYQDFNIEAEVNPFFYDMERVYLEASFGIMRAGALTLAEITAMAVPAILIPLPTAADNHQEYNARNLIEAKAAYLVKEDQKSLENLEIIVKTILDKPKCLQEMSEASFKIAKLDAGKMLANACLNLAKF